MNGDRDSSLNGMYGERQDELRLHVFQRRDRLAARRDELELFGFLRLRSHDKVMYNRVYAEGDK